MNRRSTFIVRPAFQSDTDPYAKNEDTLRLRNQPLSNSKSKSGGEADDPHHDIGKLMNAAFFSTDIDPDKIKNAISSKPNTKAPPVDKRIAAIAIALVFFIFIVDLIVQRI